MALRTVCAVALRSGTDLGVNNVRQFVTTGMLTFVNIFSTNITQLTFKIIRVLLYAEVSLAIIRL